MFSCYLVLKRGLIFLKMQQLFVKHFEITNLLHLIAAINLDWHEETLQRANGFPDHHRMSPPCRSPGVQGSEWCPHHENNEWTSCMLPEGNRDIRQEDSARLGVGGGGLHCSYLDAFLHEFPGPTLQLLLARITLGYYWQIWLSSQFPILFSFMCGPWEILLIADFLYT
jgi:hypothetical protein